MHVAVEEGQECTVESLVEKYQADINNKDIDGVSKGSLFTTLKHVHISDDGYKVALKSNITGTQMLLQLALGTTRHFEA